MKLFNLIALLIAPAAWSAELTLHFIPAPLRTDWSSPKTLAISALKNQVAHVNGGERHEIGHVYEELTCRGSTILTGVTSVGNSEERKNLFLQGYGLGVVMKNFAGMLDDPSEVRSDIDAMQATGRSNFVRFVISDSTCDRLMEYWTEYQLRGYHHTYGGLNARPLYGEGSGCTGFGMSFLELAGLNWDGFDKNWMTHVIVPRKFVGGPLTGRRVSIFKILLARRSAWDTNTDAGGFPLHFHDPEKMWEWTHDQALGLVAGQSGALPWPARAVRSNQSLGIEFDARNVPTPTGPIFKVP